MQEAPMPNRTQPRHVRVVPKAAMVAGLLVVLAISGCRPRTPQTVTPQPSADAIRAIWVTRWDYKSAEDITKIMHNCRAAGFNTVLFQVRGNGTVLYRSRLEPWAGELGGRDPGFDPLTVACNEAHRRGMTLHAWANVMPGWRGDEPPSDRRQLYHAHPDWFWRDAKGRRQPLGWYNSLNPCYPEVRDYLVAVMREIVEGYPIDGLHLDYIRFPNEWHKSYGRSRSVPDYPRDPKTLALFAKATGRAPDSAPQLWNQWRTDQVTRLVHDIRAMMQDIKPRAQLSAAVGPVPRDAKHSHFQDSLRWINEGLIDAVYPMNYTDSLAMFSRRLKNWLDARQKVAVVTGIMVDKRSGDTVVRQLERSRQFTPHFAAFAYNSLFERFDRNGIPVRDKLTPARAALRARVIPYLRALDGSPD
ncbi:MAG: family 10 glycosylhydrolase [Planctomycetes bacterium]|nr:family 10 glycosylhydrolase [Planctomycetota bacterium]